MFIEKIRESFEPSRPILIEDIIKLFPNFSRAYIFRLIKKSEANGELVKFSRGVYCIPKKTYFGQATLTSKMVANKKYVTDGNQVYGVYSGLSLLNQFSISTQIPNVIEIVTNNEATRKRVVDIDGMKYIIRKSRFDINKDNFNYYLLLQLFLELGLDPKLDDYSKKQIQSFVSDNNIELDKLIKYAMIFPAQVIKNLIGSEVFNGTI